jgi:hypothetical protein
MRLNLSLLESAIGNRERLAGAEAWRGGQVHRMVRLDVDHPSYQVAVGADRDSADQVTLAVEVGPEGAVLDSWDCTCADSDATCSHAMAAALALQHNLETAGRDGLRGGHRGAWRQVFGGTVSSATVTPRSSWICYDLTLHTAASGDLTVGVIRRKRAISDRGNRSQGTVCGWTPTAVGQFGYRTRDDPAGNRDDLIPVLCLVNRHDLRVRTIQQGFIDTFLRLFVDAEPMTLRVDGEEASVDGHVRPVTVLIQDTPAGSIDVRAQVQSSARGQAGDDFVLLPGPVPWLYLRGERCFVRPDTSAMAVLRLLRSGPLQITPSELGDFTREVLPLLRSEVTLVERTTALPQARVAVAVPVVRLSRGRPRPSSSPQGRAPRCSLAVIMAACRCCGSATTWSNSAGRRGWRGPSGRRCPPACP